MKESEKSFQTMERTYEATKADYNAIDHELQKYTQVCIVYVCMYDSCIYILYMFCTCILYVYVYILCLCVCSVLYIIYAHAVVCMLHMCSSMLYTIQSTYVHITYTIYTHITLYTLLFSGSGHSLLRL